MKGTTMETRLTTTVLTNEYRALVENHLLEKLRADNLQRRNKELIEEIDRLRQQLDKK